MKLQEELPRSSAPQGQGCSDALPLCASCLEQSPAQSRCSRNIRGTKATEGQAGCSGV